MLAYRVFPYLPGARPGEPGHPLYVRTDQGAGRLDNPDLYLVRYLTTEPSSAVGEAFANLSLWLPSMLAFPALAGSRRVLGVYRYDEERLPLLDLDDARALLERGLRPTQVVARNRPATQAWARRIFHEHKWEGIRWWSYHRPQWTILGIWSPGQVLEVVRIEDLVAHPAMADAADVLVRQRDGI